jgi:hypothetical protein
MLFDKQQSHSIDKIEFKTLIRGAHEEVLITKDCVSIVKQGRSDTTEKHIRFKIKKDDWQYLMNSLNGISLEEIPTYSSPTNKRAYDGAWHSIIIINTTAKGSFGHSFDDEEPNEKLKPIMKAIRDITNRK